MPTNFDNLALAAAEDGSDSYFDTDTALRYLGGGQLYGIVMESPVLKNGREEFVFPVNPQSLDQDEPFSVNLIPTQGGGKFDDDNGIIMKDIVISGTTGFLPARAVRGDSEASHYRLAGGRPSDNEAVQRAFSRVSGYTYFMKLRTLFRRYSDVMKLGTTEQKQSTFMWWVNLKDNEVWRVKPQSFRTNRSSRSPMTYVYNIRLTTMARGTKNVPWDPSTVANSATDYIGQVAAIRDRISAVSQNVSAVLNSVSGTVLHYVTETVTLATTLANGLNNIASGVESVLLLPKTVLDQAVRVVDTVFATATSLAITLPLDVVDGITAFKQDLNHIRSRPEFFGQQWSDAWDEATEDFVEEYGFGGSLKPWLDSARARTGVREEQLYRGETIWQFAARVLGDARRAYEIIALNNLSYPYIATSANYRPQGTVAPGDAVLAPTDSSDDPNAPTTTLGTQRKDDPTYEDLAASATATTLTKLSALPWRVGQWVGFSVSIEEGTGAGQQLLVTSNTSDTLTVEAAWETIPDETSVFRLFFNRIETLPKSGVEEFLGTDVLLTSDWDIGVSATGDWATVSGWENLSQALNIKYSNEPGSFVLHRWLGFKPEIGRRGSVAAMFRQRVAAEQTALSDPRVEAVDRMNISLDRDVYKFEAWFRVKGAPGAIHYKKLA